MDLDQEVVDASKVNTVETGGATQQPLFFLCADGKAQILPIGCTNWNAKPPHTIVCWVCGRNRAGCQANFGTKQRMRDSNHPIGAASRHISPTRRIPDYGLHGYMPVFVCGMYGMRVFAVAATEKLPAVVTCTLLQPILNVARLAAKTCTRMTVNVEGANKKWLVQLELL